MGTAKLSIWQTYDCHRAIASNWKFYLVPLILENFSADSTNKMLTPEPMFTTI